jgi:hypothetical protein
VVSSLISGCATSGTTTQQKMMGCASMLFDHGKKLKQQCLAMRLFSHLQSQDILFACEPLLFFSLYPRIKLSPPTACSVGKS